MRISESIEDVFDSLLTAWTSSPGGKFWLWFIENEFISIFWSIVRGLREIFKKGYYCGDLDTGVSLLTINQN